MADIINLRRARKRKDRAVKAANADQNRLTFGRSKAERTLAEASKNLAQRRLDAHRRDDATE